MNTRQRQRRGGREYYAKKIADRSDGLTNCTHTHMHTHFDLWNCVARDHIEEKFIKNSAFQLSLIFMDFSLQFDLRFVNLDGRTSRFSRNGMSCMFEIA